MTVAELITELEKHDPAMPVGILYDTQMGFYPAHEVKVATERWVRAPSGDIVSDIDCVCICDSA